jgi:hypothetical protein
VVLFTVMVFSLPQQVVATIAFPILMILWFVVANSCPPSPSWSYHLVIVVAMVIMLFSLLQPIATLYCLHHFMILIIVMVFLVLINVASNYTPLLSWSWWILVLLIIMIFSLLQQIVATITFFILMILWSYLTSWSSRCYNK